ncbi:MAG TPA: GNAT family N-acetyltransferase [Chloroflexota bacterium]|nr:GNAT family N-acetyltransferase [Chloroflexota bacterium]
MYAIRPYRPIDDEAAVFALWQTTFELTWPLTRDVFRQVMVGAGVYRDGDHFVAEDSGAILGFVATQVAPGASAGHIGMLLVVPALRRRGIGRALHDLALARLREHGVHRVQLGGGETYLWPGVPSTLEAALAFFGACGWTFTETSYDLTQDFRDYQAPPVLDQRVAELGVEMETGTRKGVADLMTFVAREFPSWEVVYRSVAEHGDYSDFLVARDRDGRIIGAVILYTPLSHTRRLDVRWKTLLGEDVGAIGAVGVAAADRGSGVGHALVARAAEILRERGVRLGFIGWAWMIGLYGELGFQVWQEYQMSWCDLP